MVIEMKIGEKIKQLREEANMKQYELATVLNISPQSVSLYENGNRMPDITTLIQIADFFNVSLDYITERTQYRGSKKKNYLELEVADDSIREKIVEYAEFLNSQKR